MLFVVGCAVDRAAYRECRWANRLLYSCAGFERSQPAIRRSGCTDGLAPDSEAIALFERPNSSDYVLIPETGDGIPYELLEKGESWIRVRLWSGETGYALDGTYSWINIWYNDGPPGPRPNSRLACAGRLI